jgi:hypothetical protein
MQCSHLVGKVLNLGADWRLTDAQGAFRPDARYNIQTDDGTFIYVQTEGLPPAEDGGATMLRGKFETSTNGTAAWLNDVAAVGVLRRNGTSSVLIDMWQVGGKKRARGESEANSCRHPRLLSTQALTLINEYNEARKSDQMRITLNCINHFLCKVLNTLL